MLAVTLDAADDTGTGPMMLMVTDGVELGNKLVAFVNGAVVMGCTVG
jgi:hypothetical protein